GHGRTLEYALVVGGDAYLSWGNAATGTAFLCRAAAAARRPRFIVDYVQSCERLAADSLKAGQAAAATPYLQAAAHLYENSLAAEYSVVARVRAALEEATRPGLTRADVDVPS